MNHLIDDRDQILDELRRVQSSLSGMEDLDAEQQRLAIQMNEDAEAVNVMIAENTRVAQDQTEYNARFEELSVRAEESKARYKPGTLG